MGIPTNKDLAERIVIDSEIQGGKPVIKGTRVPVEVIIGALAGGMSIKEVCEEYQVKTEDVHACLSYATGILSEEKTVAIYG